MITILLQKILAALTQLLGDIKTKLNTIKDNLDDLIILATASGPIASFTTTITKPFISCKVEIKPKQAASANPPSPSNPLPISGTDTIIVTQTEKNLFDKTITITTGKVIGSDGSVNDNPAYCYCDYIKVAGNSNYIFSGDVIGASAYNSVAFYDANKNFISRYMPTIGTPAKFTTPNNTVYIRVNFTTADLNVNTVQLEAGDTATTYEPYTATTKTVSLPETVYGGEVDVIGGSGVIDTDVYVFTGSESWIFNDANQYWYFSVASVARPKTSGESTTTENGIIAKMYDGGSRGLPRIYLSDNPSITSETDMTTIFASGQKIAFKTLETTQITLANPIELTAINGVNNVFGDTDGNTTVQYLKLYKED